MENYGILLVVSEPSHRAILSAVLKASGEKVESVDSPATALDAMRSRRFDLILLDLDPADGDAVTGDLRSAADWSDTVPIIAFAPIGNADAMLPKPFRAAHLAEAIRGLLGDDRMVANPGQQSEKLAELLGAEQAAVMVGRYLDGLGDGIVQIEAGGDVRAIGHRLGGMGGMLGFDVLSTAWLSLEGHGTAAWPTVRELTLEAIEQHRASSGA